MTPKENTAPTLNWEEEYWENYASRDINGKPSHNDTNNYRMLQFIKDLLVAQKQSFLTLIEGMKYPNPSSDLCIGENLAFKKVIDHLASKLKEEDDTRSTPMSKDDIGAPHS